MISAVSRFRPPGLGRAMLCTGGLALVTFNSIAEAQTIYRCEQADGVIYSDRPCGVDAVVHESGSPVTVVEAPPISHHASEPRPRASKPNKSAQNSAAAQAKREASCAKLNQSLREVRARLRTGYGVKEGERLKARQRQLAERRRAEKCG